MLLAALTTEGIPKPEPLVLIEPSVMMFAAVVAHGRSAEAKP